MLKTTGILFMFFKMMGGVKYDEDFLDKYGLDGFLKIRMTFEENE
jgi:hypothetical protein